MYMTLDDLRTKFKNDQAFAVQFVADAKEVLDQREWPRVDILDTPVESNDGAVVNEVKLYGNNDLLNTYIKVVTKIAESPNAIAHRRLPSYIHAPFNEPFFYVDTNTRVIDVPQSFQKNGIGVVGDHLAEIIFFHIPRFYDVVDLYECKPANIYWYNTGDKSLTYHVSNPIVSYTEGDTLIIGWAISEKATTSAGNIEFSIEFENATEGEDSVINFRLETQSARLAIKSGLVLDKENIEADNNADIVNSRAIYSNVINSLTSSAPRIIEDLPDDNNGHLDFDEETNNITFHIAAVTPDEDGVIVYNWNWNSLVVDQPNGNIINDPNLTTVLTYELADPKNIVFSDPELADLVTEGQPARYEEATDVDILTNPSEAQLYEAGAEVGTYVLSEDTEYNEEKTYYRYVPATEPVYDVQEGSTYKTLTTNVPGIYQVYVGNKTPEGGIRYVYSNIVTIEAAHEISVANSLPTEIYADQLDGDNKFSVEVQGNNGTLTYQWYQGDTVIPNATQQSYSPSETHLVTEADVRGEYWVEVTNTKNNTVTKAYSNKAWVEMIPAKIEDSAVEVTPAAEENDTIWNIYINNIPYAEMNYEMYATVDIYEDNYNAASSGPNPKTYDVPYSHKSFQGSSTSISLQDIPQLTVGKKYQLNVFIVPYVILPHSSKRRYPESAPKVVDYTWKATPDRIRK